MPNSVDIRKLLNNKKVDTVVPLSSVLSARFNPEVSLYDLNNPIGDISRNAQPGRCLDINRTGAGSWYAFWNNSKTLPYAGNTTWTWTGWIKSPGIGSGVIMPLFIKYNGNKGIAIYQQDSAIYIIITENNSGGNRMEAKYSGIIVDGANQGVTLNNDTWYHIAISNAGTSTLAGLNVYLNGYLYNSRSSAVDSLVGSGSTTAGIGTGFNGIGFFKGNMADVRFHSVVKSQSEIQAIMKGDKDAVGLDLHYLFDEGSSNATTSNNRGPIYNAYKSQTDITGSGQTFGDGTFINNAATGNTQPGVSSAVFPFYSFQNNYGYTLSGSVYIPINYDSTVTNKDAIGGTPGFTGSVRYRITNTAGILNFNPDSAPLVALRDYIYPFATNNQPPTAYNPASGTEFNYGSKTSPLYKNNAASTSYLIYKTLHTVNEKMQVLNYIGSEALVVILAGQSNAVGTTNLASALAGLGYSNAPANSYIFNTVSAWKPLTAPSIAMTYSGQSNQVGPEMSIAQDLVSFYNKEIFFIKVAIPSTALGDQDPSPNYWKVMPTTDPAYPTGKKIYPRLISVALAALADFRVLGNKLKVAVCWDQGETDAALAANYNIYDSNLKTFIAQLMIDLGIDANTGFIARQLSTNQTAIGAGLATVRTKQANVGTIGNANYMANFRYFDSSNASYVIQGDNTHATAAGQVWAGQQYANYIKTLIPVLN